MPLTAPPTARLPPTTNGHGTTSHPVNPTQPAAAPLTAAPLAAVSFAAPTQTALEQHLATCADCARDLAFMRQLRDNLHVLPQMAAPADLRSRVQAQIAQAPVAAQTPVVAPLLSSPTWNSPALAPAASPKEASHPAEVAAPAALKQPPQPSHWRTTLAGWLNPAPRLAWAGSLAVVAFGLVWITRNQPRTVPSDLLTEATQPTPSNPQPTTQGANKSAASVGHPHNAAGSALDKATIKQKRFKAALPQAAGSHATTPTRTITHSTETTTVESGPKGDVTTSAPRESPAPAIADTGVPDSGQSAKVRPHYAFNGGAPVGRSVSARTSAPSRTSAPNKAQDTAPKAKPVSTGAAIHSPVVAATPNPEINTSFVHLVLLAPTDKGHALSSAQGEQSSSLAHSSGIGTSPLSVTPQHDTPIGASPGSAAPGNAAPSSVAIVAPDGPNSSANSSSGIASGVPSGSNLPGHSGVMAAAPTRPNSAIHLAAPRVVKQPTPNAATLSANFGAVGAQRLANLTVIAPQDLGEAQISVALSSGLHYATGDNENNWRVVWHGAAKKGQAITLHLDLTAVAPGQQNMKIMLSQISHTDSANGTPDTTGGTDATNDSHSTSNLITSQTLTLNVTEH